MVFITRLENDKSINEGLCLACAQEIGIKPVNDILAKMESDQKESINDTAVSDCIRYMEEHYSDPRLDVEALCAITFISISSLQRAFIKCLAMSPKHYLIQLRMNRAFELLTKNELSVKDTAFACGFTDEKYFSRAFKKRYGFPPSHLRNNMIV
jgi:transcriptional regulator GlxA family with amidase domain